MKKIAVFLIITILVLICINNVFSAPNEISVKNVMLKDDVTLRGTSNEHALYFEVIDEWKVQGNSYLELVYSQSKVKPENKATITVEINGTPVFSELLKGDENEKRKIRIPIEIDQLQKFNEVKIKTFKKISKDDCLDYMNPANWVVIHKESYFHMEYTYSSLKTGLREFPYPYLKNGTDNPIDYYYLITDEDDFSLSNIVCMSAYIGRYKKGDNLKQDIVFKDEIEKLKARNLIYITSSKKMIKELKDELSSEEISKADDKGIIKEIVSPYNNQKKMLMIVSDNENQIKNAIDSLFNKGLRMQMKNSANVINQESPKEEILDDSNYLVFDSFNHSNVTIKGVYDAETSYDFLMPKNWIIKEGAKFVLQTRYSERLDYTTSLVTVYINDIPIGSSPLSSKYADNDVIEFPIPKDVKDNYFYNIRVVFNLKSLEKDCKNVTKNSIWVHISNKSFLYLPHDDKVDYYFEDYVSPYVKDRVLGDTLFVLSDKPTKTEMISAINISSFLGQNCEQVKKLKVIKGNEYDNAKFKDFNTIVYGTYNNSSMIKKLNGDLSVKFDESGEGYEANDKIAFLDNPQISIVELIKSPSNKNKYVMTITSTVDEGINWSSRYLTDHELVNKMYGDVVVIDETGDIDTLYFNVKDKNKLMMLASISEDKERNEEENNPLKADIKKIIMYVVIMLLVILISIVIIIQRKRRS